MARYRIIRSLGAGAAGGVYLVEDGVAGGALRALKRIEARSDPDFRTSFAREFAMLASLSLPGVAKVFDLGTLPAHGDVPPGPYFTREFVPGEPLDVFAREQPLRARLQVFTALAGIVRSLHQRGVVHGDIKPANVIVDPSGQPWLIDFGLSARARDAEAVRGSGTLPFMAPELREGAAPTAATDVYALAGTLWQLVTLTAPAVGHRGPAKTEHTRLLDGADPLAASALEVASDGLAARTSERASSADELCARIEALVGARPVSAAHDASPGLRTRGRDALLAELEALTTASAPQAVVKLYIGAEGVGKTAVLRELKWRLQLAGRRVVSLQGRTLGVAAAAQIAEQVAGHALAEQPSNSPDIAGFASLLAVPDGEPRWVLLVDDLDAIEPAWADALRGVLHEDPRAVPHVIATATGEGARQLAALAGVALPEPLLPLHDDDIRGLLDTVFGVMDPAAQERLLARICGLPGVVLDFAEGLRGRAAITLADVENVTLGARARRRWERRIAELNPPARRLLVALALAEGPLPSTFIASVLGEDAPLAADQLVSRALVRAERNALCPEEITVIDAVRGVVDEAEQRSVAHALLALAGSSALSLPVRARFAVAAGDGTLLAGIVCAAAALLCADASFRKARSLLEGALSLVAGPVRIAISLALLELYANTAENTLAQELANTVLATPDLAPDEDTRSRIFGARALIAMGEVVQAETLLAATPAHAAAGLRARALCELARIQLRRGAFELAADAAARGLALAPSDDSTRAELAAIAATTHARSGRASDALADFISATRFAEEHAGQRERALVAGYFALELERSGELLRAKEKYAEAVSHARSAGDVGQMATYAMNLGNVSFRLGDIERSEENFVLAARLARRAGRVAVALVADVNLAHVLVYLGAYARAQGVVEGCRSAPGAAQHPLLLAQTTHVLGTLHARAERTELALSDFAHAQAQYDALGRKREACEVLLDAAESLLDRGGVSDASVASAKLAQARAAIDKDALHDFRPAYELAAARARMQNGDVDGAVRELVALEQNLNKDADPELRWKVTYTLALSYRAAGAALVAAAKARAAAEQVEALAVRLSPDLREGFRRDPRRRAVTSLFETLTAAAAPSSSTGSDTRLVHGVDARFRRLLEVNKRLARERDLERVLERITDTAIELSGAERGFVLLVDAGGELGAHVVRVHGGVEGDPHVAFSRSIAEAVLIDGEPIVTVNARDDRRVNEYLSVHKLMLKSVACIPINGKDRTLGVMYLEHRMRAGRFDEHDLDLLLAFADQAAIALENARLWAALEEQRGALGHANDELVRAKEELERVLHARTEELHEARLHLEKERDLSLSKSTRSGLVGRSAAMHRVFALIDRVQHSNVPVVIQGESGTGKELVARAVHNGSARSRGPFVTVNCAALPETLIESELFGHVRGAFTGADRERKGLFAQAHGGTLFLDEFAEASARLQVVLLRVLQEGRVLPVGADVEQPVDVRVVVASQHPLAELMAQGRLREDLYYRLSVVDVRIPALRERSEDIPELCEHLLRQIAKREQREPLRLSREALDYLMRQQFPGNVRQLEHLLVSAGMMCEGNVIRIEQLAPESLPPDVFADEEPLDPASVPPDFTQPGDLGAYKAREKARILDALERHAWNRAKAAHELGMPRRTFYRRLSEFGILDS